MQREVTDEGCKLANGEMEKAYRARGVKSLVPRSEHLVEGLGQSLSGGRAAGLLRESPRIGPQLNL